MNAYDPASIEKKWQKNWEDKQLYSTKDSSSTRAKFYILDMFPYPSGEGLHVGHPKGYIATDVVSRMKRMQGFNVLHPMGFDAFGLPAENYAIKMKTNPMISVAQNVERYKKQLEILGFDYDWKREVNTTDPKFYTWTQWIFEKLHEKGLAYESYEPINWCPFDKTGLANEDVEDGKCERCGTPVEKRPMRQWVLRITKYADRLLADLDLKDENGKLFLDWPESIKEAQRNWIGRSEGVNFKCTIKDLGIEVEMYNSVPQTFRAETFTTIAPDHPLVKELIKGTPREKEVLEFVDRINKKKAQNKFDIDTDLEGIFTGRYIENFAGSGRDLPIWIASYVLSDYGTGIVNCSAHDVRDFAFAKKYNIPLHIVMLPEDPKLAEAVKNEEVAYAKDPNGVLLEPAEFKGRKWGEVRNDIIDFIVEKGWATRKINYRLKDWVFSRQRYWGEPIPVIHCDRHKVVLVPEKDLPVELPKVESYEPTDTGESPLAKMTDWVNTTCPQCVAEKLPQTAARRETNTMPQWAGSSWYHLRYMDPQNDTKLVGPKEEKYWNSIDLYVGGAEHATRHLIYARFWHKFLYDIGVVTTLEPFKKLQHVGLIMAEDGRKMSKRFGNVVNPDEIVRIYGADTLRLYEMFMGPFDQVISWNTDSMVGSRRFIERVWKIADRTLSADKKDGHTLSAKGTSLLHKTIKKVSEDISSMRFNTAVSSLMILLNEIEKEPIVGKSDIEVFLKLLAPFAPHVTEELWEKFGNVDSIHKSEWPIFDPKLIVDTEITVAVQINGKVRATFVVPAGTEDEILEKTALSLSDVVKWLNGNTPKKIITVKGKLVNIVI